jgi:hypothetical protein
MEDKVSKLKQDNLRKEEILRKKREKDHHRQEEELFKKFIMEK